MSRQRDRGINLIELLVALSIVIILTVIAIPSFRDMYIEYRLTTAVQKLYYVLQYARSEAVKNNTTVFAVFQTGSNWCYGANVNASCNCSVANNCALGAESASTLPDVSLSVTGMNGNNLQFEGTHGSTYVASTVTFSFVGQTSTITLKIGSLGNMQICSATISGYPTCT